MKVSAGDKILNGIISKILQNLGEVNFGGKTILVTGGAGFLGSWICDVLVRQQAKVICLDNLSSGLKENITHLLNQPSFQFLECDISEPPGAIPKVDMVMHLASRASPLEFAQFPLEILKANTVGTMTALEIAREHQARFLFASTSEVYGNPAVLPTPESYYGSVNPVGIRGCYDEGKRCGEALVMAYHRQYGLDVRIARIFNTYGPMIRGDGIYGRVVSRFIDQALTGQPITVFGTGEQTRSFCYVADQIEGLLRLAFWESATGKVVNTGNNEELTIMELAQKIKGLVASSSPVSFQPLPPDDPARRCPDITLARTLLGWEPRAGLEEGLTDTIQWFRRRKK